MTKKTKKVTKKTKKRAECVGDLERNDIDGALELFDRKMREGTWGPDDGEALLMLQDDPHEIIRRLAARAGVPVPA